MPSICGSSTQPVIVWPMPQVVPADYLGMHFSAWPIFNASLFVPQFPFFPNALSPAPTGLNFGTFRIWDTGYGLWGNIEQTQGVYTWTNLDTIITAHRAAGRTLTYTLAGTPTIYVSGGDAAHTYYDVPGGGGYPVSSSPNGLTALWNFITALVTRYNAAGGAWRVANPTLGKGLQAIETWNEPSYTGFPGFWYGTVGQLVDVAFTVRTAAKAVDAALTVTSPGFNNQPAATTFLTATGTINAGVTGAATCDVFCVHQYNENLPGTQLNTWTYDVFSDPNFGMLGWRAAAAAGGISALPIWMGEGGFDFRNISAELTLMAAQTPAYRAVFWARMMALGAAFGFKKWITYSWEGQFSNTPMADSGGVPAAINAIAANVVGKTITSASYVPGGAVSLKFSDMSSFTV